MSIRFISARHTHISIQHSNLHIFSYSFSDTLVHFKTLPHLPQTSSYSTHNNNSESHIQLSELYASIIHNEVLNIPHPPSRRRGISTSESVLPFLQSISHTPTPTRTYAYIHEEPLLTIIPPTATGPSIRTRSGITKQPSDSIIGSGSRGCLIAADGRLPPRSGLGDGLGIRLGGIGPAKSGSRGSKGGRWWLPITDGQSRRRGPERWGVSDWE